MSLLATRNFLLGAYHDLPNVLFMGSLVLGSITGYLPLVWVAFGLIINGGIIALLQGLFNLLLDPEHPHDQVKLPAGMGSCSVLHTELYPSATEMMTVAPSHWLAAAAFFSVFSIFNSLQVAIRPAKEGADMKKVSARRAVSASALIIGVVFFALVLARGFTGCETWLGSILGVLFGSGIAIGYWYFLDACGSGTIPDILQIVSSSAPAANKGPMVCS